MEIDDWKMEQPDTVKNVEIKVYKSIQSIRKKILLWTYLHERVYTMCTRHTYVHVHICGLSGLPHSHVLSWLDMHWFGFILFVTLLLPFIFFFLLFIVLLSFVLHFFRFFSAYSSSSYAPSSFFHVCVLSFSLRSHFIAAVHLSFCFLIFVYLLRVHFFIYSFFSLLIFSSSFRGLDRLPLILLYMLSFIIFCIFLSSLLYLFSIFSFNLSLASP